MSKPVGKRWSVAMYVICCIAGAANCALISYVEAASEGRAIDQRVRQIEQAAKQMDRLVRR